MGATVSGLFPFLDQHSLASAGPIGLLIVCVVIFAETGLLIGFVFPGDTLLLITGISAEEGLGISIWIAAPAIAVAAFLGGELGYYIGKKTGPRIFERRDSGFFSRAQVTRTYTFFDKYGPLAVILARFVPIVRTLAPIAAGVGKMDYKRYSTYNAIGAAAWGFGITFVGYLIGFIPPVSAFVQHNIDLILLGAVIVTLIPTIVHVIRNQRAAKRSAGSGDSVSSAD